MIPDLQFMSSSPYQVQICKSRWLLKISTCTCNRQLKLDLSNLDFSPLQLCPPPLFLIYVHQTLDTLLLNPPNYNASLIFFFPSSLDIQFVNLLYWLSSKYILSSLSLLLQPKPSPLLSTPAWAVFSSFTSWYLAFQCLLLQCIPSQKSKWPFKM